MDLRVAGIILTSRGRFAHCGLVACMDSDPAAGSDKAASERRAAAGKSGRFAPSGLVACAEKKSDPAEGIGSDKAAAILSSQYIWINIFHHNMVDFC